MAALAFSGCRGKEESSNENLPPPQLTAKVLFNLSSGNYSQGTIFTRTVEIKDTQGVFFAAFDLTYDPAVIEFIDAMEGTFLNKNGSNPTAFHATLQNGTQGRIVIGMTRLGQIGDVSGSGTLLTLSFRAVGAGTTTLAFSNPKGFKNMGNQDVVIETWENGSINVQ